MEENHIFILPCVKTSNLKQNKDYKKALIYLKLRKS